MEMVYPKTESTIFFYQNIYSYFYFFKTVCPNFFPPLPKIFPLWVVPNHIIMIQNQQEFKIQNYNAPWTILILNAMFI